MKKIAPEDYIETSRDGDLQSGIEDVLCLAVIIQHDENLESCEMFNVSLTFVGGPNSNILLNQTEVSIAICDDDSKYDQF